MTAPPFLKNMFNDRQRWQQRAKHLYLGEHEGKKVGNAVATMSSKFDRYALNKPENQRLLAALRSGNIDMAFVVAAKLNGFGPEAYEYVCACEAEILAKRLEGMIPPPGAIWRILRSVSLRDRHRQRRRRQTVKENVTITGRNCPYFRDREL